MDNVPTTSGTGTGKGKAKRVDKARLNTFRVVINNSINQRGSTNNNSRTQRPPHHHHHHRRQRMVRRKSSSAQLGLSISGRWRRTRHPRRRTTVLQSSNMMTKHLLSQHFTVPQPLDRLQTSVSTDATREAPWSRPPSLQMLTRGKWRKLNPSLALRDGNGHPSATAANNSSVR
jgi:hypothetical protein